MEEYSTPYQTPNIPIESSVGWSVGRVKFSAYFTHMMALNVVASRPTARSNNYNNSIAL